MKKSTIFFLLFIYILLIVTLISAQSLQYQTIQASDSLCPRESGLFKDKVRNTETVAKQYTASLSGSASSFSTVLPTSFILTPGEEKEIFTYITPRTDTQAGTYDIKISFVSGKDTSLISHTVAIKNCYGVALTPKPETANVCPSEIAKYEVNIANNGEYAETFYLSLDGQIKDRVGLSDKQVILNKGESKSIILFVNSPTDSGSFGFSLVANSASGKSRVSLPLTLSINPCFDFSFVVQSDKTSYEVCDRTATVVQLRTENKGTSFNEFDLQLDAPQWVRLSRNSLGLMPNEVRVTELYIAPEYGVEGNFEIKLTLVPKKGNQKATSQIDVKVKKCTNVKLEAQDKEVSACKGINNDFEVLVTNTGELEKTFQAGIDAPEWVAFNTVPQFNLKAGEEKKLVVRALPPEEVSEEDYKVKVGVKAADASGVVARDEAELNIEVVSIQNCYKPLVSTDYTDGVIYYDSSVPIPITITNTGSRRADYSLFLTGNSANFVKLNPSTLNLDPGKSETVYLYVAPDVNVKVGQYNAILTINLQGSQLLTSKEFKFEITDVKEKVTVQENTTSLDEDTNVTISSNKFLEKSEEFIKTNKAQVIVVVVLVLFVILSFILGWHKSFIEFFEEDEEEESEKKEKATKKESAKKKQSSEKIKEKVEE